MMVRGLYDDAWIGDLCVLLECQKKGGPGTCEQCMQEIGSWGRGLTVALSGPGFTGCGNPKIIAAHCRRRLPPVTPHRAVQG